MSSDLWVISCYFNPCRYKTKRRNFDAFRAGMAKVGANLLTIEWAYQGEPLELAEGDNVLHLRGGGLMWQKERLLNIAAARLPGSCTKIAWLDNDLLFGNPNWYGQTSEALDDYVVVQPFDRVVRLPQGQTTYQGTGHHYESFASVFARAPGVARRSEFVNHGHTGFAWAARRELFEKVGLYDPCLTCSGDHLMSHGFAGGLIHTPCIARMIGPQKTYLQHYLKWAIQARDLVGGKIGVVPGNLLHLWHGDLVNRRFAELNNEFKAFDFDPDKHLRHDENGLFEWADAPPEMQKWASELFWMRREDGDPDAPLQQQPAPAAAAAGR
jgi:8-oxo-dGTP pyrophosphatase MutT (NUDIX family)